MEIFIKLKRDYKILFLNT